MRSVHGQRGVGPWFGITVGVGIAALLSTTALTATVTFTDTEFLLGNWNAVTVAQTNNVNTLETNEPGGNPGAMRSMRHQMGLFGSFPVSIDRAHLLVDPTRTFTPSASGAINFVNITVDGKISEAFNNSGPGAPATMRQYFAVRQGGTVFVANAPAFSQNFTNTAWPTVGGDPGRLRLTNLTAANFAPIGGGASPDFSATGGALQFGYVRGTTTSDYLDVFHDADNFEVVVDFAGAPPPPPPGTSAPPTTFGGTDEALSQTVGGHHTLIADRLHGGTVCGSCSVPPAGGPASSFAPTYRMSASGSDVLTALMAFDESQELSSQRRGRQRGASVSAGTPAAPYVPRWTAFSVVGGQWGSSGGSANQSGFDFRGGSMAIGLDRFISSSVLAGIAYGGSRIDGGYSGGGNYAVDSQTFSGHAAWRITPTTYLDGVVSYTWASLRQNRVVGPDTFSSSFRSRVMAASATLGRDERVNSWLILGASVGMLASHTANDGYQEQSSSIVAGFNVPSRSTDSFALKVAGRAAMPLYFDWGSMVPQVGLSASRELREQGSVLTAVTTDTATPVLTTIDNPTATRYTANGGLSISIGERTQIGGSLSHTWAQGFQMTALSGRVRVRF